MSDDGSDSTLGLVFAFLSVCVTIYGCFACCYKRNKAADRRGADNTLRAPLVPTETPELNRAQVSFKYVSTTSSRSWHGVSLM